MESETYIFKKYLGNSQYGNFNDGLVTKEVTLNINEHLNLGSELEGINNYSFKKIVLPQHSFGQLVNLLKAFSLENYIDDFLCFQGICQSKYILYNKKNTESLEQNFIKERQDLDELFKALELYFFGNRRELHSISFKYNKKDTITLKNFFVVKEVYDAIIDYYEISTENFQTRKDEILNGRNNFKYNIGGSYIKGKIIQAIFNFVCLKTPEISKNEALKFCGVFLHICQIPSNTAKDEVLVDKIEDSLASIDYTTVGQYLSPRTSYFFNPGNITKQNF